MAWLSRDASGQCVMTSDEPRTNMECLQWWLLKHIHSHVWRREKGGSRQNMHLTYWSILTQY